MKIKRAYLILAAVLLSAGTLCAQNDRLRQIDNSLRDGNLVSASRVLASVDTAKLPKSRLAFFNLLQAKYSEQSNKDDAYSRYLKAKMQYAAIDSVDRVMEINISLAYIATSTDYKDTRLAKERYAKADEYLRQYMEYAKASGSSVKLARAWMQMGSLNIKNDSIYNLECFRKALKLNNGRDKELESGINNNLAVLFNETMQQHDSSLWYLRKNVPYFLATKNQNALCENYINQAANYYYMGEYQKSIGYLRRADSIPIKKFVKKTKSAIKLILKLNYTELHDYKNAFENLEAYSQLSDSIKEEAEMIAVNDIEAKYQNKENRLKLRNYTMLIIFISALLIAIIIALILVYRNFKRKQKIAEQEKIIGQQNLEKTLRDHELSSIDSMLEGQERERRRVADELHDNLGSMLSALKLNFQHLRIRQQSLRDEESKLYQKTDELIEEAYQKVRDIAHAQNAGVMANQGLVPAIQKMAEKIAIPNKLSIEVVPFGLEGRLDNGFEISVFRMVQEMVTNVIKHASASEIVIHLTQHENSLNLMVEDNGKGFNPDSISKSSGMGLANIERKVVQLGGTFTIDSIPDKGTTIIIDLPL
ncbi:MAG: sensor histidine kinase [Flavobacterium sp.]|nr:MAG: sensor histidine kinase [Flavobacterium sp.]